MSKAFTRESDDEPEFVATRPRTVLPPGSKNYLTPDGAERLRAELAGLLETRRPQVIARSVGQPDKSAARHLDQRIAQLEECLSTGVIVPAAPLPHDQVRFGAFVTIRHRSGDLDEYRIVGVDEMDADRGWVSWLSPIAKALINAKLGQRVRFRFPSGEDDLEIVAIRYPFDPHANPAS